VEALCRSAVLPAPEGFPECGLNIAEGYTFGNTRTFTRYLGIAYGSAVETVDLLKIGTEAEILPLRSAAILERADLARRLLLGLLKRRRRFNAS